MRLARRKGMTIASMLSTLMADWWTFYSMIRLTNVPPFVVDYPCSV